MMKTLVMMNKMIVIISKELNNVKMLNILPQSFIPMIKFREAKS